MQWPWSSSPDARRTWTVLVVVLLAVLAPTLIVLWFMNEAVSNERFAVRQRLQEVYQRDLSARQKRLEEAWTKINAALEGTQKESPAAAFADLVSREGFTSAVIYRDGQLAYPQLDPAPPADSDISRQAQDVLQQARKLLADGKSDDAIKILGDTLQQPLYNAATDAQGRLLSPNAALLAVASLPANTAPRADIATRLATRLSQYDGTPMRSSQRLFLMEQLHALTGEEFPTQNAERWALEIAQSQPQWDSQTPDTLLPLAGSPGVWEYQSSDCRIIFTTADLQQRFAADARADAPASTTITLTQPGETHDAFLTVPANALMPGWHLDLALSGADPFAAAARQHALSYFWMAALAIATMGLTAGILAAYLGRQMRLTRLKNDLIATVSHELKTPLSSMRVLVETLIEGRIPGPREQHEYLDLIARENMRLSRLIDNFLTFSRMERHKAVFEFSPVSVSALATAATRALGDRGSCIEAHVPPHLMVWGDDDALVTVLVNLLDNAWKYAPESKRIQLTARAHGNSVEIAVRDWGIGIARRHQRRIFQRFYQIDRELSRRTGGCGLGLAIVDYIVHAHHGTITVESHPGAGSTFTVRLPACQKTDAPPSDAGVPTGASEDRVSPPTPARGPA